ncbi:MAG TPA: OmpW family outer membrane protein [Thermoanaerobaculia bacterium]|jgi:outer membrane protein W
MTRIFYRALFLLFVIAGLRVSAQQPKSEIGLWTVGSYLSGETLTSIEGESADITFEDDGPGFGLSFNRYWTDNFSTELAVMTFQSDMRVETTELFLSDSFVVGQVRGRATTAMAQWHFRPGMRFTPYLGAGIAHITGEFDPIDFGDGEDSSPIDLESDVTWTAAAGFAINITDRWAVGLEAKHVPWSAVEEGGAPEEALDVNPMLYGTSVRFRF